MQLLINWKETNESCIYCGESISLKEVLTTEIEHILPKSKSMDNSHNNTTCSCLKCNKEKNNRTPYQYLTSENRYEGFKNRVMNQYDKMLLFSQAYKMEDSFDFEGMVEGLHNFKKNSYIFWSIII